MSRLNVDKITGATGTASGAPITLSGDTATLSGTGVTFPAGHTIQTKYYSRNKCIICYVYSEMVYRHNIGKWKLKNFNYSLIQLVYC